MPAPGQQPQSDVEKWSQLLSFGTANIITLWALLTAVRRMWSFEGREVLLMTAKNRGPDDQFGRLCSALAEFDAEIEDAEADRRPDTPDRE